MKNPLRGQFYQVQSNGDFDAVLKVVSVVTLCHNEPLRCKGTEQHSEVEKETNSLRVLRVSVVI